MLAESGMLAQHRDKLQSARSISRPTTMDVRDATVGPLLGTMPCPPAP
jgi:hypothetical protein